MIAEPARRADHDMRARGQFTLLAARVHAADAGNHARIGMLIEPGEFAMDLKRQFARRRDDQRQRGGGALEPLGAIKQVVRNRQTIGDRLARTGLRRNQQVAAGGIVGQHRGLDLCQPIEVAFRQSSGERRMRWAIMSRDVRPWLALSAGNVEYRPEPKWLETAQFTTAQPHGLTDFNEVADALGENQRLRHPFFAGQPITSTTMVSGAFLGSGRPP